MRRSVLALLLSALPALGAAQTAPPPPAGGGAAQMVRAAGMPLNDGALPPGTLTVRVVQGAFTGNLSGLDIALTVDGQPPKHAQTGGDGRAEFAHLPIGARVQASTTVGGEPLMSEAFAMPAESGVRLLLVAGDAFVDTATAAAAQSLPASGGAPVPAPGRPAVPAGQGAATEVSNAPSGADASGGGGTSSVAVFRAFMVTATLFAFALVGLQQWRRRRGRG